MFKIIGDLFSWILFNHIHEWSPWEPIFYGSLYQSKRCKKCGLIKEREI